jgi:capsular polysaccharide biosynthesis protein
VGSGVILLRRALIVIVVTGIAGALAYGFSQKQQPRKVATAWLVFGQLRPEMQIVANGFSTGDQSSQFAPGTNASLVSADDVARSTARKLAIGVTQVRNDVSVSARPNSQIVTVQASRPTAAQAAQLANTYVNVFVSRSRSEERRRAQGVLKELRAQLASLRESVRTGTQATTRGSTASASASAEQLRTAIVAETALARSGSGSPAIAQTASPSDTSTSPKTTRNTLFATLFGLVLGIGIAGLTGSRNAPIQDNLWLDDDRSRSPVASRSDGP